MIEDALVEQYWSQYASSPADDEATVDRDIELLEAVERATADYSGRGADALVRLADAAPGDAGLRYLGASNVETHLDEAARRYRRGDSRALELFEARLRASPTL